MSNELRFKTNTLLKNLVGKDLINDDNIAIVELVKNAYDALSPSVSIRFAGESGQGEATGISKIIIVDKGVGMSLVDIRDKWLNIAYSEKKHVLQPSGAYFAGNKGVGRFSCDRLGRQLDLVTRVASGKLLHLPINWMDFEVEGDKDKLIQDIPLFISAISEIKAQTICSLKAFPEHGTVLVISNLRSSWDRDRLLDIKRALEKFLNPNQLFQRNAFKIKLSAPSQAAKDKGLDYYSSVNGEIRNQVFEKLKFNSTYIESKISNQDLTITTELYHEGEAVFRLVEKQKTYSNLGDVGVIIYYLNSYKKAYFTRQAGVRVVDFGSIFLFLNGFRVAPYGDRGNDWLGLDVRKSQGQARFLGSRDLVGRIELQDSEERYAPVSSREGLKNTDEFKLLRESYFMDVLRKLERFVVDGLDWDSVPPAIRQELASIDGLDWESTAETYAESWDRKKRRIVLSILGLIGATADKVVSFWFNPRLLEDMVEDRSSEVRQLMAEIEGIDASKVDHDLKAGLAKIRDLIAEKEAQATSAKSEAASLRITVSTQQQRITKLADEKETFRAQTLFLQSVAPHEVKDLLAFHHQINHDSTITGNYISIAIKEIRKQEGGSTKALEALQKAALTNQRIAAVARFATKANFRAGMKKELTDIPAFFDQYISNIAKDFSGSSLNIIVKNSVREPFELKASRIELSILIDNIISNSTKALSKRLEVGITLKGKNKLNISFKDDGRGLASALPNAETMFELGVTTTPGSGLGLYHARRIAEEIGGTLSGNPLSPRGMEILFEVDR